MGPKLFQVPILLGLAYIGMAYLSWTLAQMIVGDVRSRVFPLAIVATFAMVAWDLSMDPIWSQFVHTWTWHEGGSYLGVPLSNFYGCYFTVYTVFQSFALYLQIARPDLNPPCSGVSPSSSMPSPQPAICLCRLLPGSCS